MPTLRTHIEAEQWIEYDYDPPCPETNHNAAITICSVTLHGVELLPALSRRIIDELEALCFEDMAYKAEDHRY